MDEKNDKKSLDQINSQRYHEGRAPITVESIREAREQDIESRYFKPANQALLAIIRDDAEREASGRPPRTPEERRTMKGDPSIPECYRERIK